MRLLTSLALLALLLPAGAAAERVHREHGYLVHHNAFTTDRLPAEVARAYGIERAGSVVLINIAVQRDDGASGVPVRAQVQLDVRNLVGQPKRVSEVREVIEGDAIYYLATTDVAPHETLDLRVEVLPEGGSRSISFRFTQRVE